MNTVSFVPLGGIGDVTKNMYLYEYNNQILIVDCGLGFADETMLGVDLLLPDISYLLKVCQPFGKSKKRIAGMVLTHGHEDHIGALPFILPQLPKFPIFGTVFTAALANAKLAEFGVEGRVEEVKFGDSLRKIGDFEVDFIRVTHSIPDTSHVFIRTPLGSFYHGSDFKFDETPYDGKKTDFAKISKVAKSQVLCMMSDCLGSERKGRSQSEITLLDSFLREMKECRGKFIATTYSSNISRLNQIIEASEQSGRKVCFIGRSLIRTKEVAKRLEYMTIGKNLEIKIENIGSYSDDKLTLIVAGSQGQENSAMSRIASGEHKEVRLSENDIVVFSADPIPGNETSIYELIDAIAKKGIKVFYSAMGAQFHVSGHGSLDELSQLVHLVKPKNIIPIGGSYRHMFAYRDMTEKLGYKKSDSLLIEDGQEIIFSKEGVKYGKTIPVKKVYVDEISGEAIEHFILRDRQKLSEGGIAVILVEVDSNNGQLVGKPDIIMRGLSVSFDIGRLNSKLFMDFRKALLSRKGRVINWIYVRKLIGELAERRIFKELHRRPLVLPVVIEV
ncbi:MAG: ribonuclease J [Candidatus Levybacteria bacterium]|nr:ribonuclease J [Candidatus Levybacteria bacterium]